MSFVETASVAKVRAALAAGGSKAQVIELSATARSAQDAATALGCPLGAIVKSLVFAIDGMAVLALVSGDRQCDIAALPAALGIDGTARRADADRVRTATGFAIGGVAPVGHPALLPTAIDDGLRRFEVVWAAAGHPHCVFASTADELTLLTGGVVSTTIAR